MNRNLYLLWAADTTAVFGASIYSLTLTLLALEYGDNPLQAGFVLFASSVPYLFFGILGGVVADRVNRKRLMVFCDLGRAILVLSVPIAYLLDDLTLAHIIIVGFCVTCLRAFHFPAGQASVPLLIEERDNLTRANSYISSTANLGIVLGPALGGIGLLITDNVSALLFVNVATFTVSALCVALIKFPAGDSGVPERSPILQDAIVGFRYIFSADRRVPILMLAFAVQLIIGDGIIQLGFPVLLSTMDLGGEKSFGFLLSVVAIAGAAFSFAMARLQITRPDLWIFGGYALRGLCYLFFALAIYAGLPLLIVAAVVLGISITMGSPTMTSILQSLTRDSALGKVMAVRSTIGNLCDAVAYLFVGALLGALQLEGTLYVAAVLASASAALFYVIWKTTGKDTAQVNAPRKVRLEKT